MSIRKLNTKTKLPVSCYKSPRMEREKVKFVSETKTREGREEDEAMNNVFVVQFFPCILLGQLTIKIN